MRSLHAGESPWWLDLTSAAGVTSAVVVRVPSSRIPAELVATNIAALSIAEEHGLPAPRLLAADPDGRSAGAPASIETVVAGTSTWPATPSIALLRSAGAAIAGLHTLSLTARPDLPYRPRPIAVDDFATDRRSGLMPSNDLLDLADRRLQAIEPPSTPIVFVHGDVWPGNTTLVDNTVHALIDWKTAGAGHPGVDLGELRKQVTILSDDTAADHVLTGWQQASGTTASHVAYWDAIAALNTPTDSYSPYAARRRDDFLRNALSRL